MDKAGDIVKVAPGYGRNFLIPKHLASEATPGNIKIAEQEKQAEARKDFREKEAAAILAQDIVKYTPTFKRKTGEGGSLYGSVTAIDIADFLVSHKVEVVKRKIQLDEPIKTVGEYQVPVRLHREVTVPIKVIVESEPEEAS